MAEIIENGILIRDVETKTIMTKSSLPVGGYSVNPYVGCTHGCKYCYGIDPIQFAMVMVITLVYAGVTPPVGGVLFITMGIAKVKIKETLRYLPAYLGVVCISLLLLIFFPKISLFLPHLLF